MKPIAYVDNNVIYRSLNKPKGNLFLASNSSSELPVVLKAFSCYPATNISYIQERNYLQRLNHPNILKMLDHKDLATVVDNKSKKEISYILTEYVAFGDLCDHLEFNGGFSEILTRMLFHQIVEAVSYIHDNEIAHMDLKAENVMLDRDFNIKVIDFDLSQNLGTKQFKGRGTCGYRCPEVIVGYSDDLRACDVYSLGVILFILFSGHHPYREVSTRPNCARYDQYYKLLRSNPEVFWEAHTRIKQDITFYSESFKGLIMSMLNDDPLRRATIEDIKRSEWYNGDIFEREVYEREMKRFIKPM